MRVPEQYRWIVRAIGTRRATEAGQAALVIGWLVAFLLPFGLLLEQADQRALEDFCRHASDSRNDVSMNRLVYSVRNIYAELRAKDWIDCDPAMNLRWKCDRHDRDTFDIDLAAIEALLKHGESGRHTDLREDAARDRLLVRLAVDASVACSELSALNHAEMGRRGAIRIAIGTPRERIARLSPQGLTYSSIYLGHRRDLFGLGSDALFASARGARQRLPIRSIANIIQEQIADAGLTGRITPADLGRYGAAKLMSEGMPSQDAILMIGYKRIPAARSNEPCLDTLQKYHPLHL
ncbi:hypothetical protein JQ594_28365 [Bradyrhizobium manausense]|uniref:tyrosine-type recombinase/integrase n=1 Tax=Bradyrhizobium manausense TaxID=989370 RepID=UPI001BAD0B98|nr:tyrosine-type recombinase/integrase [Bradyrhizobium manausense]MBR0689857.1 hypothetical protein [Bradyrhizobium manausense]